MEEGKCRRQLVNMHSELKEDDSISNGDNKEIVAAKSGLLPIYQVSMMVQEGMKDIQHVLSQIVEIKMRNNNNVWPFTVKRIANYQAI